MVGFTGIVGNMFFQVAMSTQCNLVGGWMEMLFRNVVWPCGEIHNNSLYLFFCTHATQHHLHSAADWH
jgi:hypothetical protein